ncbi:hypothetical protein R6Q59_016833 [Mikania micrantha]
MVMEAELRRSYRKPERGAIENRRGAEESERGYRRGDRQDLTGESRYRRGGRRSDRRRRRPESRDGRPETSNRMKLTPALFGCLDIGLTLKRYAIASVIAASAGLSKMEKSNLAWIINSDEVKYVVKLIKEGKRAPMKKNSLKNLNTMVVKMLPNDFLLLRF